MLLVLFLFYTFYNLISGEILSQELMEMSKLLYQH